MSAQSAKAVGFLVGTVRAICADLDAARLDEIDAHELLAAVHRDLKAALAKAQRIEAWRPRQAPLL